MAPTLREGDRLVGWRTRSPRVGRIVCFPHRNDEFWMVKRVIAVGVAVVEIADGDLSVNLRPSGHLVEDLRPVEPDGRWVVAPGEMFVLSDAHHLTRADSRKFGPIPTAGSYTVVWPRT